MPEVGEVKNPEIKLKQQISVFFDQLNNKTASDQKISNTKKQDIMFKNDEFRYVLHQFTVADKKKIPNSQTSAEALAFIDQKRSDSNQASAIYFDVAKRLWPAMPPFTPSHFSGKENPLLIPGKLKNTLADFNLADSIEKKKNYLTAIDEAINGEYGLRYKIKSQTRNFSSTITKEDKELTEQIDSWNRAIYRFELLKQTVENSIKKETEDIKSKKTREEINNKAQETERKDKKTEQELREKILMNELMEVGGIQVMTSSIEALNQKHSEEVVGEAYSGFKITKTANSNTPKIRSMESINFDLGVSADDLREEKQVNELVVIAPKQPTTKTRKKLVEKTKWFGLRNTQEEETETYEEPAMHSDIVKNGKNEPAFTLKYQAMDTNEQSFYKDYTDRPGQNLEVHIDIPQSTAKRLADTLEKNPKLIRKIVEDILLQKMQVSAQSWKQGENIKNNPLRPPYEKWTDARGGKDQLLLKVPNKEPEVILIK